ncbi:uncharacterized protein LOC143878006 [Tasmannia lanceolata]|uniref:uncharacterized protein LOC143878006 n=1 Tax=Tasmannia lanceolata TaxID=3420 RepID=UPI004062B0C7
MDRMTELFEKLSTKVDQLSTQSVSTKVYQLSTQSARDVAESSEVQPRTNGGWPDVNGNGGTQANGFYQPYAPRLVKLDFPSFNGREDPTSWVCRAEQFFDFHATLEAERVALASFHLEGDTQLWYQLLKQEKGAVSWKEFSEGLHSRYGPTQFLDFFGELTKLQQTGSVNDYQTQFEKLLAKVSHFQQTRQVSCFVSGLKDSIKADVMAASPATLSAAIGLARLYEACNLSQRRAIPPDIRRNVPANKDGVISRPILPVRKVSPAELQERRAKGLCYNCNEKFSPGHRCKKLFVIEACLEEVDGDVIMEDEDTLEEHSTEVPEISLNAISGVRAPETMRVKGSIERVAAMVLIDSGSTQNFVSETLAKKVGLWPIMGGQFEVVVASGAKLSSSGKCMGDILNLQGVPISIDFYLLPLEGYDVVLGTQWLRTLGPIIWDFSRMQMKFKVNDKEVTLQGLSNPEDRVVDDSKFIRTSKKNGQGVLLQLFAVGVSQSLPNPLPNDHNLQQLMEKVIEAFEEPNGLPPPHLHDHKIPLLPGSGPVIVKPYQYPHYPKMEIERLVAKMLATGVIRPSNSPYSSPVILVKKQDGSWRMCVYYKALNKITIKDKFPIPVIDELLDELNGARSSLSLICAPVITKSESALKIPQRRLLEHTMGIMSFW